MCTDINNDVAFKNPIQLGFDIVYPISKLPLVIHVYTFFTWGKKCVSWPQSPPELKTKTCHWVKWSGFLPVLFLGDSWKQEFQKLLRASLTHQYFNQSATSWETTYPRKFSTIVTIKAHHHGLMGWAHRSVNQSMLHLGLLRSVSEVSWEKVTSGFLAAISLVEN